MRRGVAHLLHVHTEKKKKGTPSLPSEHEAGPLVRLIKLESAPAKRL